MYIFPSFILLFVIFNQTYFKQKNFFQENVFIRALKAEKQTSARAMAEKSLHYHSSGFEKRRPDTDRLQKAEKSGPMQEPEEKSSITKRNDTKAKAKNSLAQLHRKKKSNATSIDGPLFGYYKKSRYSLSLSLSLPTLPEINCSFGKRKKIFCERNSFLTFIVVS